MARQSPWQILEESIVGVQLKPDCLTPSEMAMYIRVKRNKTTYFIQCDPTETILDIKEKLFELIDHPTNDQRLVLIATNEVLDDRRTLADLKVENDAVVALTLRKEDEDFEDVYIARPDDFTPYS